MSRKIENAREKLMSQGRAFLLNNQSGKLGRLKVRDLTTGCGMAMGTFYHYFDDKEDLILQIMDEDWNRIRSEILPVASSNGTTREKLKIIYEKLAWFERTYRNSVMGLLSPSEKALTQRRRNQLRMGDAVKPFLSEEIRRGEITLTGSLDHAAYLLVQLFLATERNPEMDFDDLWNCLTFSMPANTRKR